MFDIERVRASWQREATAIETLVESLDEQAATQALRDDGWTAQDLLGHIGNAARGFVAAIDGRIAGDIDIDSLNAQQRERGRQRSWSDTRAYWRRARDEVQALIDRSDSSVDQQPVTMSWLPNIKNAGDALRGLIIHTRSHREEIEHGLAAARRTEAAGTALDQE